MAPRRVVGGNVALGLSGAAPADRTVTAGAPINRAATPGGAYLGRTADGLAATTGSTRRVAFGPDMS
jgi:hypothetical protein